MRQLHRHTHRDTHTHIHTHTDTIDEHLVLAEGDEAIARDTLEDSVFGGAATDDARRVHHLVLDDKHVRSAHLQMFKCAYACMYV